MSRYCQQYLDILLSVSRLCEKMENGKVNIAYNVHNAFLFWFDIFTVAALFPRGSGSRLNEKKQYLDILLFVK